MNWDLIIEVVLTILCAWQWKRAGEGRGAAEAVIEFLPKVAERITEARSAPTDDIPPHEMDPQQSYQALVGDIMVEANKRNAAQPLIDAFNRQGR
tara:strand:+ start:2179 stop:2463 length:285 start_codon:yes stop_codon:yes gene_type:complete